MRLAELLVAAAIGSLFFACVPVNAANCDKNPDHHTCSGSSDGGKAEEIASEAFLYNDPSLYALNGDEVDGTADASRYQHHEMSWSGDCSHVLATRVDKPTGTAFLWTPFCSSDKDERWMQINQTGSGDDCDTDTESDQLWGINPARDFDQDDCIEAREDAPMRMYMRGAYQEPEVAESEGAQVQIRVMELDQDGAPTSGTKFIIEYVSPVPVTVTEDPDIRIIEAGAGNDLATICEVIRFGKRLNRTRCEPVTGGTTEDGMIQLPFKVEFHRNPPAPP